MLMVFWVVGMVVVITTEYRVSIHNPFNATSTYVQEVANEKDIDGHCRNNNDWSDRISAC